MGLMGLSRVIRGRDEYSLIYGVFFLGVFCVCWGSAYYHWHPDNARLIWDRLPMTIGFMAFFAAVIGERVSLTAAKYLLVPLLVLGISSVLYWHHTEMIGHGDLRAYGFVQFFPMLAIPYLLLAFRPTYTAVSYLWLSLLAYLLAKLCELADRPIYQVTHQIVSGHTIKHLLSALSCYLIYCYVCNRKRVGDSAH